jgi:hypothetical protein
VVHLIELLFAAAKNVATPGCTKYVKVGNFHMDAWPTLNNHCIHHHITIVTITFTVSFLTTCNNHFLATHHYLINYRGEYECERVFVCTVRRDRYELRKSRIISATPMSSGE